MGDIGKERREVEFEPLPEEPVVVPAPVEPAPEPAHAPAHAPAQAPKRAAPA